MFALLDAAFAQDPVAREAIFPWLQRLGIFTSSPDDWGPLRAVARRSTQEPPLLSDVSLLRIRELLSSSALDDLGQLAVEIGKRTLVDGYIYVEGIRRRQPVLVAEAYLSASIAGGGDPWSRAAGDTPGLQWIDQRYVSFFRNASGGLGARAFFALLGAETAPRPKARQVDESRHGEWASAIENTAGGRRQRELSGGRATHLRNDYECPDLERVLDTLPALPPGERRPRAQALFSALRTAWRRLYSDVAQADAVYSDYSWRSVGPILRFG
ncbi:hypothetical protein AYO38_05950 [bacterium SCGC AG-212-C10]|nr:hypothetical protein AYO38_05950 [bacterium SCGC AG-212-C10]